MHRGKCCSPGDSSVNEMDTRRIPFHCNHRFINVSFPTCENIDMMSILVIKWCRLTGYVKKQIIKKSYWGITPKYAVYIGYK